MLLWEAPSLRLFLNQRRTPTHTLVFNYLPYKLVDSEDHVALVHAELMVGFVYPGHDLHQHSQECNASTIS